MAFEVAPGAAAEAIAAMRTLGIGGFAVTTPHKADVAAAVDEVDAAAAALRSVNTVVLRDDGSTFGVSTDGDGFVDSLPGCRCRSGRSSGGRAGRRGQRRGRSSMRSVAPAPPTW